MSFASRRPLPVYSLSLNDIVNILFALNKCWKWNYMPDLMFVFDQSYFVNLCCTSTSPLEGDHTSHVHTVSLVQSATGIFHLQPLDRCYKVILKKNKI